MIALGWLCHRLAIAPNIALAPGLRSTVTCGAAGCSAARYHATSCNTATRVWKKWRCASYLKPGLAFRGQGLELGLELVALDGEFGVGGTHQAGHAHDIQAVVGEHSLDVVGGGGLMGA